MMHSFHHETHVETLLNSLAAERHIRSALLSTLIDELEADPGLAVAAEAARAMSSDVATLSDGALRQRIEVLRHLVRAVTVLESGLRLQEPLVRGKVSPPAASAA